MSLPPEPERAAEAGRAVVASLTKRAEVLAATLQSIMNDNLSKHGFWHCHENWLNKTIQMIPHNL